MTPQTLTAWTTAIAALAGVGVQVGTLVGGWIQQAHPSLTPEETHAIYATIMADDAVRAALAEQAAHPAG